VQAFVDVPADYVHAAREFWSAATGRPPGEPWTGHLEVLPLGTPSVVGHGAPLRG
jgi:hypothetical protein